jgi:glycosyltransferase involved in cell wall biosynthesis
LPNYPIIWGSDLPYKILPDIPKKGEEIKFDSIPGRNMITFLQRQNPEGTGGVQRLSTILTEGLAPYYNIEKIVWRGAEWAAPIYFPLFFYRGIRSKAELIYCDDAVTSLIGARIRAASHKKVVAAAHGLDLILPISAYQKRVRAALRTVDKVITISRATAAQLNKRGIDPEKIEIIYPAAETAPPKMAKDEALYGYMQKEIGIDLRQKKVLLSVGRPVKRKGFDRFISEVFPHLPDDYIYIVAGPRLKTPLWIKTAGPVLGGKLYHNLLLASGSFTMHDDLVRLSNHPRVLYLNGVSQRLRDMLYASADLFIMPNRTIEGDMEGFGLVALEAAMRGVPVIASGIEGITDAVIDGENGFCVPEGDNGAILGIIMALLGDPLKLTTLSRNAREFTSRRFSPERAFAKYRRIFDKLLESRQGALENSDK